eukprot:5037743-Prymnesium_polylepis.2
MIHVQHERGTLSLTPDHVLFANGHFVAARDLKEGAVLAPASRVTAVRHVVSGDAESTPAALFQTERVHCAQQKRRRSAGVFARA